MNMSDLDPTRRRFGIALGTLLGVPLAGCMGDDGEPAGTETEPGTDTPTETDTEAGTTGTETATETGTQTETETETETTTEGEPVPDGQSKLGIKFVNGEGEPVEVGMNLTLQHNEYESVSATRSYVGNFDETKPRDNESLEWPIQRIRSQPLDVLYAGTYTATVEPYSAGDFETVERTIEISEEELSSAGADEIMKWVTIEIPGAESEAAREQRLATVMEGTYRIDGSHAPNTEFAWGVQDGSTEGGVPVVQQEWNQEDYQTWTWEPVDEEGKWHRVVANHNSDLVWSLGQNEDTEGLDTHALLYAREWGAQEADKQLWRVTPLNPEHHEGVEEGDEVYKLVNKWNGASPSPDGGSTDAGANILLWWFDNHPYQRVQFYEQ